jgi:hypothetical protein
MKSLLPGTVVSGPGEGVLSTIKGTVIVAPEVVLSISSNAVIK